jgi:hypothetical protein
MKFSAWFCGLPEDGVADLPIYDVWRGAVETALAEIEREDYRRRRQGLEAHKTGMVACVSILKGMLDKSEGAL